MIHKKVNQHCKSFQNSVKHIFKKDDQDLNNKQVTLRIQTLRIDKN